MRVAKYKNIRMGPGMEFLGRKKREDFEVQDGMLSTYERVKYGCDW